MTGDYPQNSQEPEAERTPAGGVDIGPKKTEKEPVAKVAPGLSKERLKAGASRFAGGRGEVGGGYGLTEGVGPGLGPWIWGWGVGGRDRVLRCGLLAKWCPGVRGITKRSGSLC